jgi:hypothetical protein
VRNPGYIALGVELGEKAVMMKDEAVKRVKDRLTGKPRNTERDAEIVRLRDQEKLSFGKIGYRLVKINSAWANKKGKPMSRDAVEKAYHRMKCRTDK